MIVGYSQFPFRHDMWGLDHFVFSTAYICMVMYIITRSWLALLTKVESSLLFFGNTTFKYRRGLGKCMEMMDVNGYRLSVVVDYYNMHNVQIKGT